MFDGVAYLAGSGRYRFGLEERQKSSNPPCLTGGGLALVGNLFPRIHSPLRAGYARSDLTLGVARRCPEDLGAGNVSRIDQRWIQTVDAARAPGVAPRRSFSGRICCPSRLSHQRVIFQVGGPYRTRQFLHGLMAIVRLWF